MKRLTLLSLAVLFGSAALTAQTADQHQTQTLFIRPLPSIGVCPVSVRAQQAASWDRMEVDHSRPKGVAQFLHLTLGNASSNRITNATVTVRGLIPKDRATLTPLSTDDVPSDAAKTLDVTFPAGSNKDVSSDLWVPGLSAVYSIDLISITYADGSKWKLAEGKTCRTPVDGMMLISGR